MLRESINAGFNKEGVGEEHEECLNWIDKQLDKQQNINHMLVNRMDQLTEGIQTLLHRSELSEQSRCSPSHHPTSRRPTSHHSSSPRSASPPVRIDPIQRLVEKLPENRVYQRATGPTMAEPQITWKPEEIRVFDPHLDVSCGVGDLVSMGNGIYYCDVHLFVAQVANITRIRGSELVARNLHMCLHGTALQWYAALDSLQQIGLRVSYNA